MKLAFWSVFLFLISCICSIDAALVPTVDKRAELMGIVAHLAGFQEYKGMLNSTYAGDVDLHFGEYRNHPAVLCMQEARRNGVGYDAVMQMAASLSAPPELGLIPSIGDKGIPRWNSSLVNKFVPFLQDFYVKSKADEFFRNHQELYSRADREMPPLFKGFDKNWYATFYGIDRLGNCHIVLSLTSQPHSYSVTVPQDKGDDHAYAFMGMAGDFDAGGRFVSSIPCSFGDLLIHEFNHPFVNPLIKKYEKNLSQSGMAFFEQVKEQVPAQYSAWDIVMAESIVRAATIRYLAAHGVGEAQLKKEYEQQAMQGFSWLPDLVSLLDSYEKDRKKWPTLAAFLPRINDFFADRAKQLSARPHVVSIDEIGDATSVSPSIKSLTVRFSTVMDSAAGMSIYVGNGGMNHFPPLDVLACRYSTDGKSFIIQFKKDESLKSGWDYALVLKGDRFRAQGGLPLRNKVIAFKTAAR